jgi:flavin reductase (DIM6/NTAB) family NADH-FMN oxidoreductase RutF
MAKEVWKPGNMLYPLPAVLVTVADDNGNDNVFTVAWTGTVCTDPAMVYISVRPSRYSYDMIKATSEFVINLTTEQMAKATDYCGVKSGRDENKFESMKLQKEKAKYVKAPLLKDSPVNIECQVVSVTSLGTHDMFLAKVLCVHADKKYMDSNGKFDLEKARPLVYSHGWYYNTGNKLGKFGFSVKRKLRRK